MLFSSLTFLYYFLPVTLILYFIAPKKLKNSVLLLASLFFYAWGEPKYIFLMVATILLGYVTGLVIEKHRDDKIGKFATAATVALDLLALGYFKYANFFVENFSLATRISVQFLNIALPIGISFYTFQILSYTIDVKRGTVAAQRNIINLATYITLFPQLIAGPIVRYSDVETQLSERTLTFDKTALGIRRFILGLSKKIILANSLGQLCDSFVASSGQSVVFWWLYALCYLLQIYFDFSGYSDMAIGLGKILGFEFMENFNYPLISSSITDFWRRWHISLGSWFRDYVYIPLGGNRVKHGRHLVNIFVVWFLTGFWHGAEWNFIIWGLYFGILLTIEKFYLLEHLKKHKFIRHIYVLFFVLISFVIFSGNNMTDTISRIGGMFGAGGIPMVSDELFYAIKNYGLLIVIAIIFATPLPKILGARFEKVINALEIPALLILLIVCTAYLADGSFNPFLYFRF